jgi:hypothetical protein
MVHTRSLSSVLLVFTSVALAGPPLTPQSVLDSCSSVGAKATLERLYNDQPQWDALLAGIATGTPAWLEVATTLHVVSDAGSSEQLGSAVGEALEHRPANVLALAIPNFLLEVVCGAPADDPRFDSYELSMAAIERREAKLRATHKHSLAALRDACMSELEKAKGDVARFYEHET